jgi:hypothetical protein
MALTLNNIPVSFKDELLSGIEERSALAQVAPTTRIDLGDNLMTFSLGLQPAPIVACTTMSNLPGEGEVKPVGENGGMVTARAYKFAQIIPVSAEYMYKLPRLYDEIIRQAPETIAKGVDYEAFASTTAHDGFAGLNVANNAYAPIAQGDTEYEMLVNAFGTVAEAGHMPNAMIASPAEGVALMTMTAQDGHLVFGTGADGVGRVFGAQVVNSNILGAGENVPAAVIGDFNKSRLGFVDNIRIKILEEATLTTSNGTINLAQQNMVGVLVEGWAAFAAAEGAFARIGGASA